MPASFSGLSGWLRFLQSNLLARLLAGLARMHRQPRLTRHARLPGRFADKLAYPSRFAQPRSVGAPSIATPPPMGEWTALHEKVVGKPKVDACQFDRKLDVAVA